MSSVNRYVVIFHRCHSIFLELIAQNIYQFIDFPLILSCFDVSSCVHVLILVATMIAINE